MREREKKRNAVRSRRVSANEMMDGRVRFNYAFCWNRPYSRIDRPRCVILIIRIAKAFNCTVCGLMRMNSKRGKMRAVLTFSISTAHASTSARAHHSEKFLLIESHWLNKRDIKIYYTHKAHFSSIELRLIINTTLRSLFIYLPRNSFIPIHIRTVKTYFFKSVSPRDRG